MSFEMQFSHCGGGCHGSRREWKGFFNAYDDMTATYDEIDNFGSGGSWTFGRTITSGTGGQATSRRTTISKIPNGTYEFCGPVDVWVESNAPLSLVSQSG